MPSSYITKLAASAYKAIEEAGPQADAILDCFSQKPASAADIEQHLGSQPMLQAQVAWRVGYTPSKWLLEKELEEVRARREACGIAWVDANGDSHGGPDNERAAGAAKEVAASAGPKPDIDVYDRAARSGLMGICFSGGGIRSATFNLGVLQGLAELRLLRCFDYLSSVSGGGYAHQFLAAWGKRESFDQVAEKLIPLPEPGSPKSHPEPIRWLRRYSNYLTPERGLFTADTWVIVATWLRNTILNEIILISGLLFLVIVPHVLTVQAARSSPTAASAIGIILYLFLLATTLIGKSLLFFSPTKEGQVSGQAGVQVGIVLPLLLSSLIFTSLFPIRSAALFGVHLVQAFFASLALLLVLTLTVTFAGKSPLNYLHNRHLTEHFASFGEFWRQKPKCRAHLKAAFSIVGFIGASLLASLCGAAWVVLTDYWVANLWSHSGDYWWKLTLVIDPPLVSIGALLAVLLLAGLLGRTFDDPRREWLARFGAWMALYSLIWIIFVGVSLFGHAAVKWLSSTISAGVPVLVGWAGTTLGGLLAGRSSETSGPKADTAPSKFSSLEALAVIGPYVFIAGLLLAVSALAEVLLRAAVGHGSLFILIIVLAPLIVCLLFAWRVDINAFSMHAFYRDRLARCYLGASNASRKPNPFTGFDENDTNVFVSDLRPTHGYYGPFPIFCTTLNLTFGEDLAWQERKGASFALTPLYSGYDVGWTAAKGREPHLRFNGFVETEDYAYPKPGIRHFWRGP